MFKNLLISKEQQKQIDELLLTANSTIIELRAAIAETRITISNVNEITTKLKDVLK